MVNNLDPIYDANTSTNPCEINVEDTNHLGVHSTIRSLLNALKVKLQIELEQNPKWSSTEELVTDQKSLEEEYTLIKNAVSDYANGYEDIKTKLKGHKDYENKLRNMTNEDEWVDIRKAIDDLWIKNYSEKERYKQYSDAWDEFEGIRTKTCRDKAKDELTTTATPALAPAPAPARTSAPASAPASAPDEALILGRKKRGAKEEFLYYKDFKTKVDTVFGVLAALKTEIEGVEDGNIRKKYAYYLEFKEVLDQVRNLSPDDSDQQKAMQARSKKKEPLMDEQWLKKKLMETFKDWVFKVYNYFYWHKDWLAKSTAVDKAWNNYEDFIKNRKMQFLSEAEEVPTSTPNGCE